MLVAAMRRYATVARSRCGVRLGQFTLSRNVTVTGRRALGRFDVISSLSTSSFVVESYQQGQRLECVALVNGTAPVSASARLHVICNCQSLASSSPRQCESASSYCCYQPLHAFGRVSECHSSFQRLSDSKDAF